jgi:hypothetical protein
LATENQIRQIEKEEITFKEILSMLTIWYYHILGKWKLILLCALLGGLIGLGFSFLVPVIYTAQLTFVLENGGKPKLGGSLAAQFGLNIGETGGMFQEDDNIMALMKSRSLVTRTLLSNGENGKELLVDRYMAFNAYREKWKDKPILASISFRGPNELTRLHDSLLTFFHRTILAQHLTVEKPDKKVGIISITTNAPDELFAKSFTENLLHNVTDFYIETQTKKSQENVGILRRQTDSVRNVLNSAITGVAMSSDANPNINPALQRLKVPSQRRMVDVEMNKSILQELVTNLEIAEITLRKETPLVQVIDNPVLPLERTKLGKLKGIVFGTLAGGFLIIGFYSLLLFVRGILKQ